MELLVIRQLPATWLRLMLLYGFGDEEDVAGFLPSAGVSFGYAF